MIKNFLFCGLFLCLYSGPAMAQSADEADTVAGLPTGMSEVVELVEKALVDPVADLQKQARKGYGRDRLVYGLALKVGRMGPAESKNAEKWIKKASNSFERPGSSSNLKTAGGAEQPALNLEKKSYSNGIAIPTQSTGGRTTQSYVAPSYPSAMNTDLILVAVACVDALMISPDPRANIYACGSQSEYHRLQALMPKFEN